MSCFMFMHYVNDKVIITASILYVLLFSRINLAICKNTQGQHANPKASSQRCKRDLG